jgi:hypothetical protein
VPVDLARTARGALAGATAASVWALQQPLDKRVFGCSYDDVELLGKVATRGHAWPVAGLVLHLQNGALFGAVYASVVPRARARVPGVACGAAAGLIEHVGLWPAGRLTDRFHPARRELPRLTGNRRAFWQATWRHLLFGLLLGELERRLNPSLPESAESPASSPASSNGHGSLEHTALGSRS